MATAKEKREAAAAAAKAAGQPTEIEKLNEAAFQNPGATPHAGAEIAKPSRSGATVTVACKLGVPYFDLQLTRMDKKFEQNMQGGRNVTEGTRDGPVVRLRGTAYPRGTPPKGFPPPPLIVGGAALNPGIDKDWWDQWVEQNKLNPLVANGFIFAHEREDHVVGRARDEVEKQSGLEPVDPANMKKDSRVPRSTRSEVANVAAGER